jgi:hypothetical protein
MAAVATAASTFQCPHGFPMTVSPVRQLLTVDGQSVIVQSDLMRAVFACAAPVSQTSAPCAAVVSIDDGMSSTLTVGGEAVALENVSGTTSGVKDSQPAKPFQITSVNQSKLEAA